MLSWCSLCNRSGATEAQIVVRFPQLTLCGQDDYVLPHLTGAGEWGCGIKMFLSSLQQWLWCDSRTLGMQVRASSSVWTHLLKCECEKLCNSKKDVWHQALGTQCGIRHQCGITQATKAARTNGSCVCDVIFHLKIKLCSLRESYSRVLVHLRLHNETTEPYLEK